MHRRVAPSSAPRPSRGWAAPSPSRPSSRRRCARRGSRWASGSLSRKFCCASMTTSAVRFASRSSQPAAVPHESVAPTAQRVSAATRRRTAISAEECTRDYARCNRCDASWPDRSHPVRVHRSLYNRIQIDRQHRAADGAQQGSQVWHRCVGRLVCAQGLRIFAARCFSAPRGDGRTRCVCSGANECGVFAAAKACRSCSPVARLSEST